MSQHIPVPLERWTELVETYAEAIKLRSTVQDLSLRVKLLEAAGDALANEVQKPQAPDYHPLVAGWIKAKKGLKD